MISSIQGLDALFSRHAVKTIYIKILAEKQDNDKNQIYLGKGLDGIGNLFPLEYAPRTASKSTKKRKSTKGRVKLEGELDFGWLDSSGNIHDAPNTRIIDYFQYPEVRMSGFLTRCDAPPDALRRMKQAKYGQRILCLGKMPNDKVLGYVLTEKDDPLISSFPELPVLSAVPVLRVRVIGKPSSKTPRDLLLNELRTICQSGWHSSMILKPNNSGPIPFRGNQGGGYTLEALLGITANADKAPDKYGYEIKTFTGGKISLMTPVADGGYEGEHGFRKFMLRYGRAGEAKDGRRVFTGVHRVGSPNKKTGYLVDVRGFNNKDGKYSEDTEVVIFDPVKKVDVASWSLSKLINSWNKKHASALYIKADKREHKGLDHDNDYRYLSDQVYVCEGTNVWRLLDAIRSGAVYYDPAHCIYADDTAKVRPQWRINTNHLETVLSSLYKTVEKINLG